MKKDDKQNKQKIIYIDDGSTVVDMDVEGFPWYGRSKERKKKNSEKIRFKEKLAIVFGAYRAYLPYVLIGVASLGLCYLIIRLWLGG